MKLEELEQRILAVYDGNPAYERDKICGHIHASGDCCGISCEACPLSMRYLAKMMRKGRGEG